MFFGRTGCASCRAATAGPRLRLRRRDRDGALRPGGEGCRRSCTSPSSTRPTTITGSRPWRRRPSALDIHNAAGAWNKALLDNAARPSGALVFAGPAGATLYDPQFERLKAELETNYQGAANAGRPILLDGGLTWHPLSPSRRRTWTSSRPRTAPRETSRWPSGCRRCCSGCPATTPTPTTPRANRAFYRQTVVPLVKRTSEALAQWLAPAFGEVRLDPDLDAIEALATERESLWRRVSGAEFLTEDEKREAVGYGRREPSKGDL
jgi:phage portal protein BeeE